MHIREFIVVPQLEVRIAILDIIAQTANRRPKYLCDFNGTVDLFSEKAIEAWRMTAEAWLRTDKADIEVTKVG